MLSIFRKSLKGQDVTAEVKVAEKKYPDVVYQIHNEFNMAGEKLLQESRLILDECAKVDKQKGTLLKQLGFTNTPQAKTIIETEQKELSATMTAELVNSYTFKYPNHKFITENMVGDICKKYNLVCGDVSLYKGFVPEKNLKEIAAFEPKETGLYFSNGMFLEDAIIQQDDSYYHIYKKSNTNYIYSNYSFQSDNGISFYGKDDRNIFGYMHLGFISKAEVSTSFQICAPLKDMETKGMDLKGYRLEKHIPDPVILHAVRGGFIIITAWGDEASDELVVNQKMN